MYVVCFSLSLSCLMLLFCLGIADPLILLLVGLLVPHLLLLLFVILLITLSTMPLLLLLRLISLISISSLFFFLLILILPRFLQRQAQQQQFDTSYSVIRFYRHQQKLGSVSRKGLDAGRALINVRQSPDPNAGGIKLSIDRVSGMKVELGLKRPV